MIYKKVTLLLAGLTVCCSAANIRIPKAGLIADSLDHAELARLLQKREGVPVVSISGHQRDSTGSKLFIRFSFRRGDQAVYRTAVVTGTGIDISPGYPMVIYDDRGDTVFRLEGGKLRYDEKGNAFPEFEDAKYVFTNGLAIPRKEISNIMGVTGQNYILIKFREAPAWIVSRPESPRDAVVTLPVGFDPYPAYATSARELVVFGVLRSPKDTAARGLIYEQSLSGFTLSDDIPMPWAGNIYDMASETDQVLAAGDATKFAGLYLFNVRTKEKQRVGFDMGKLIFLQPDVVRSLHASLSLKTSSKDCK